MESVDVVQAGSRDHVVVVVAPRPSIGRAVASKEKCDDDEEEEEDGDRDRCQDEERDDDDDEQGEDDEEKEREEEEDNDEDDDKEGKQERQERGLRQVLDPAKREKASPAQDPREDLDHEYCYSEASSNSLPSLAGSLTTAASAGSTATLSAARFFWMHCWRWLFKRLLPTTRRKRQKKTKKERGRDRRLRRENQLELCEELKELRDNLRKVQDTIECRRADWFAAGARYCASSSAIPSLCPLPHLPPRPPPPLSSPPPPRRLAPSSRLPFREETDDAIRSIPFASREPSTRPCSVAGITVSAKTKLVASTDRRYRLSCNDCGDRPEFVDAYSEILALEKEKAFLLDLVRKKEKQRRDNRIRGYSV